MASHNFDLLSSAAFVTIFFIVICSFSLTEALNGGFSVDLIHRDFPDSPFYDPSETPSQRMAKALRRSIYRVDHFKPTSVSPEEPQSEVIANRGEYLMKYSVGTPPFPVLSIADTGSDLIWLQCKPCTGCYEQTDQLFDPEKSKTYKKVACTSGQCHSLDRTSCSPSEEGSSCQYSVSYGDQSFSNGDLAFDTLTLGSTRNIPVPLRNIIIGCGHHNDGTFNKKGSGIIGLGGGTVSLVSQLRSDSIGGKFSYCLVPISFVGNISSKLSFGSHAVVSGSGTVSTPLVPKSPDTFYYLTLEGMSVGDKILELGNSSSFENSKGNIIIDSGTTLTLLPADFYSKFELAVAEEIDLEHARADDPNNVLSLCYKSASDDLGAPVITAHFTGADVKLNPLNTFVRITEELVCLAFHPDESLSIFGNLAQMNFLVGYDIEEKTVSFKPTDCTKL